MYKIVSLQAENVQKLKAIHITPKGDVITLAGDNGAGKSSVLDSIMMTLGGGDAIPQEPIRKGQKSAKVVIDLGDLVVTRRFTPGSSEVIVANKEGTRQSGPQGILDKLVGQLAFDPLEFATMEPKEQLETLQKLVGLDFSKLNSQHQQHYDKRRLVNRDAETAKAKLQATTFDETAPAEEVSAVELAAEVERINAHNNEKIPLQTAVNNLESYKANLSADAKRAADAVAKAKTALERANADYNEVLDKEEANLAKLSEARIALKDFAEEDATDARQKLANADETNRKVRANKSHNDLKAEFEKHQKASAELTAKMDAIEQDKHDQLSKAKFPLPELSFDENGVLFNGTPFAQASDGEKLRTSVAIGVAMNPKLRVMFVRNGSMLDKNGLQIITDMAQTQDFQIWIEDNRSTDPAAITIADGQIQE